MCMEWKKDEKITPIAPNFKKSFSNLLFRND